VQHFKFSLGMSIYTHTGVRNGRLSASLYMPTEPFKSASLTVQNSVTQIEANGSQLGRRIALFATYIVKPGHVSSMTTTKNTSGVFHNFGGR